MVGRDRHTMGAQTVNTIQATIPCSLAQVKHMHTRVCSLASTMKKRSVLVLMLGFVASLACLASTMMMMMMMIKYSIGSCIDDAWHKMLQRPCGDMCAASRYLAFIVAYMPAQQHKLVLLLVGNLPSHMVCMFMWLYVSIMYVTSYCSTSL